MKKNKASVLVVALIILGVILVTTLSMSLVAVRERKASIGSSKSDVAYQNAETGVETVMNAILKKGYSTVGQVCSVLTGSGYKATLLDKNNNPIDACGTSSGALMANVLTIRSVGNDADNQDQRAIEAAVAASGDPCAKGNGFGLYLAAASAHNGSLGGYTGAASYCQNDATVRSAATTAGVAITKVHMCSIDEILRTENCGTTVSVSGDSWYSAGIMSGAQASGTTGHMQDCLGWTNSQGSANYHMGPIWTTSNDGTWEWCNASDPVLCCTY